LSRLPSRSQQTQAEQEEEYITNKLMKRLDELKKEKEHLARQVEMEEENITNKLSKKLEKVKQEKVSFLVPAMPGPP
jgi:coiled-coil domain-containing protein 6